MRLLFPQNFTAITVGILFVSLFCRRETTAQSQHFLQSGRMATRTNDPAKSKAPMSEAFDQNDSPGHQRRRDGGFRAPRRPTSLEVPGYHPASHVGPERSDHGPMPVVVVLHGNFDRPEWECEQWRQVAGFYGWILCPRGIRTPYATPAEDRWTYGAASRVKAEIEAGLKALESRYPGQVTRTGSILVGFSLGAVYAPRLSIQMSPLFSIIFLIEGGLDKNWSQQQITAMKRKGIGGVGLAMSAPDRRSLAKKLMPRLSRGGIQVAFVDMKGAGHNYSNDFSATGRRALEQLLQTTHSQNCGTEPRGKQLLQTTHNQNCGRKESGF